MRLPLVTWTFITLLLFSMVFFSRSTHHSAFKPSEAGKLTHEELNRRFGEAILKSLSDKVVLEDMLGEGPGAWSSAPRYPANTVNCMVWLQLLLAESYGKGLPDKTSVMDRIRYYSGQVGFSTRKHYVDHWLAVEPAPLKRVELESCASALTHRVQLEPKRFSENKKFACPLYKMALNRFDVRYYGRDGLLKCARGLASGFYVMFAVPTAAYLKMYASESGPMGLVHALVLKLGEVEQGKPQRSLQEAIVYHASTSAKQVLMEPITSYFERMKKFHQGYVVYELDPNWDPKVQAPVDDEMKGLLECEAKLGRN